MKNEENSSGAYFKIMGKNKRDFILHTLTEAARCGYSNFTDIINNTILGLDDLDNLIIKQLNNKKIKPDDLNLFYNLIKTRGIDLGEVIFDEYATLDIDDKKAILDGILEYYKSVELLNDTENNSVISKLREQDTLNQEIPLTSLSKDNNSTVKNKV